MEQAGGGGGYYGGTTNYAGTNYIDTNNFTNTTSQTGQREGNGYVKITLISAYPEVSLRASTTSLTKNDVIITATGIDNIVGLTATPYSWNNEARTSQRTYTATKNQDKRKKIAIIIYPILIITIGFIVWYIRRRKK